MPTRGRPRTRRYWRLAWRAQGRGTGIFSTTYVPSGPHTKACIMVAATQKSPVTRSLLTSVSHLRLLATARDCSRPSSHSWSFYSREGLDLCNNFPRISTHDRRTASAQLKDANWVLKWQQARPNTGFVGTQAAAASLQKVQVRTTVIKIAFSPF